MNTIPSEHFSIYGLMSLICLFMWASIHVLIYGIFRPPLFTSFIVVFLNLAVNFAFSLHIQEDPNEGRSVLRRNGKKEENKEEEVLLLINSTF